MDKAIYSMCVLTLSCLVIVNGQRNKVLLSVTNKEDVDYSVLAVSAKISHPDNPDKILRNVSLKENTPCWIVLVFHICSRMLMQQCVYS